MGAGSGEALARSFVNDGQWAHFALRSDGVVVFASASASSALGLDPDTIVGTNALDWLHPDDVERAFLQLMELNVVGSTPGAALFRVKRADGSWLPIEAFGSLVHDGEEVLVGVWARSADHQLFLEELLAQMVAGASRVQLLESVLDGIDWARFESNVAIAWAEGSSWLQVDTGVQPALGGGADREGTAWEAACRDRVAQHGTLADLDEHRRELAQTAGLGAFWVEPVVWAPDAMPATITIWTAEGPRAPGVHAYGVGRARGLVDLVLRWTDQAARLDEAARSDPLTGLSNHRAFFSALSESPIGGAVLYCDLDHFKPVNDDLGHAAGDALLKIAARRIQRCVRAHDIVGRLGGDEFAVLCAGINQSEATEIAHRILRGLNAPFRLGHGNDDVRVSVSIGVAITDSAMSEELVKAADRALKAAKATGRGRVCLAEGD
jgi:diguanylate cyclase (GGDEF)-like protein/PAS domain S-box-containing protein